MAQAVGISVADRPLRSALIVDDHPLFCDALSMTLAGQVGLERVEAVGSLGAALDRMAAEDVLEDHVLREFDRCAILNGRYVMLIGLAAEHGGFAEQTAGAHEPQGAL